MRNRIRRRLVHGLAALTIAASALVGLTAPPAPALTGDDGLIAIATENGIEVFDSAGDGSDLHILIPNEPGVRLLEPAWSPTGDRIAYTTDAGDLFVARADGSEPHQINAPTENAFDAAWSPDGRIAYVRGGSTVVISDPDGSHEVIVDPRQQLGRPNVYTNVRPAWTTDGRLMVQLSEPGVMEGVPYIADGDGQSLRPLTEPGGMVPELAGLSSNWQFSSAGLVAYVVYEPLDDNFWIHLSSFDGRHIGSPGWDDLGGHDDIALSPSGQRAVSILSGGGPAIWDIDLTQPEPFTSGFGFDIPGEISGLDWQPTCSITGTPGDDVLVGTPGPDLICGLGGNDEIRGRRGNDVIYAGRGDDSASGGWANDVIVGGPGADTLEGNRERDLINSRRDGRAADTVDGGLGHNVCLHDKIDVLLAC